MKTCSRISRFAFRFFFHTVRFFLRGVELVSPRLSMPIYTRLLILGGMTIKGSPRYISLATRFDDFNLIEIGERSVISERVVFLTHDYSVTTALVAINKAPQTDIAFLRPITIGTNVFIGLGSIILPGASIGDNVIVGAGSVVRGTVPADSVISGNPAKRLSSLTERAFAWERELGGVALRVDQI